MIPVEKKEEIRALLRRWLDKKIGDFQRVDPLELIPNPFLIRIMGLKEGSPESYEFRIRQRLERTLVTSFGSVFQEVLKVLDREAKVEDIDLVFTKDGRTHYVQLKSGTEGFTRPALRKTRQTFEELKRNDPDCVTVIGFAYGTQEKLSPIWGSEAQESADLLLAGESLWDYFLGEGAYRELLDLFEEVGNEVITIRGKGESNLYRMLVNDLLRKL